MSTLAKKRKLVVLDECAQTLRAVARIAAPYFEVRMTRDPREALALLEGDPAVAAFVTEHVLSTSAGISLLETARSRRRDVRRVLLGDYAELGSIVAGIHSGAVQQFVAKPLDEAEFIAAILPDAASSALGLQAGAATMGLRATA